MFYVTTRNLILIQEQVSAVQLKKIESYTDKLMWIFSNYNLSPFKNQDLIAGLPFENTREG